MNLRRSMLSVASPVGSAAAVGVCPACLAASASALSWLGLGALIPVWRPIAFGLLALGILGFLRDFQKHRQALPLLLLVSGGILLYLGRYVFGGAGFGGWPIWGPGAILALVATVLNRRLFRARVHASPHRS